MTEPMNPAQEYADALQELQEAREARSQLMARFAPSIDEENGRTLNPGEPVTPELVREMNAAQRRVTAAEERLSRLRGGVQPC